MQIGDRSDRRRGQGNGKGNISFPKYVLCMTTELNQVTRHGKRSSERVIFRLAKSLYDNTLLGDTIYIRGWNFIHIEFWQTVLLPPLLLYSRIYIP